MRRLWNWELLPLLAIPLLMAGFAVGPQNAVVGLLLLGSAAVAISRWR